MVPLQTTSCHSRIVRSPSKTDDQGIVYPAHRCCARSPSFPLSHIQMYSAVSAFPGAIDGPIRLPHSPPRSPITSPPTPLSSHKPHHATKTSTHTFNPASPESVYSFNMVLLLPPAPAARAEEGRGAVGARRLMVSMLASNLGPVMIGSKRIGAGRDVGARRCIVKGGYDS